MESKSKQIHKKVQSLLEFQLLLTTLMVANLQDQLYSSYGKLLPDDTFSLNVFGHLLIYDKTPNDKSQERKKIFKRFKDR